MASSDQDFKARALYGKICLARQMVERFVQDFGRPPSDIELRVASTLFIEENKGSRGGGRRSKSSGGSGGSGSSAPPPQQDRSVPILQRTVPRGKHQGQTWSQLLSTEPDYIEWALANVNWFTDQEKAVLLNALSQGQANNSPNAAAAAAPSAVGSAPQGISQPDDDLPF